MTLLGIVSNSPKSALENSHVQPRDPKNIAAEYIRSNFRLNDRLAVVLIHKHCSHVTTRISTSDRISSEEYLAWLRHMNSRRNEVYLSMNTLAPEAQSRQKNDISEIRHIYLDFDEKGVEAVKALRDRSDIPEPNHILTSSPGKFQVIWRVEAFSKEKAEDLMRGMTRATGADVAATDSSRVLRVPGFWNHKYSVPHYVTVEDLADRTYRPENFPQFEPAELRTAGGGGHGEALRPRSSSALSQSEHDWAYVMRALDRGDSPDEIVAAIEKYRGDKPNPGYYARHTVDNALREHLRRTLSR
jgi:hypothetical protein